MSDTIIEISGADYCGKTTHAEMLTFFGWNNHAHNFGGYGDYGQAFPQGLEPKESWEWWFQDSSIEELGTAIATAYNARQHAVEDSPYDIGIVERGSTMARAQLVATFATRHEVAVDECVEKVDAYIAPQLSDTQPGTNKIEFALEADEAWLGFVSDSLKYVRHFVRDNPLFTPMQNEFYAEYLANLRRSLRLLNEAAVAHPITLDAPAIDIQNRIRQHPALDDAAMPELLEQNPLIIGLAGLSEAGKGAVAQELVTSHGFTRLKLGFFNETIREGTGEPYGNPHKVALSALRFIANNRHLERITLESLHGPHLSAEFKVLLGERWKSVMIEVPEAVRKQRLLNQFPSATVEKLLEEQRRKDATKLEQGLLDYRELADLQVDNSGSISETVANIVKGLGL